MNQLNELRFFLKKAGRRMRFRFILHWLQGTLWVAFGVSLAVLLAGRIWPVENLWGWASLSLGLWLLGNLAYALIKPWSEMKVARQADWELGLKERLSTSLALACQAEAINEQKMGFSPFLMRQLHEDALMATRKLDVNQAFKPRLIAGKLLIAGALLLACMAMVFLPNPMDAVLAERRAVAEAAAQEAQKLEEYREEIAESQTLTPEGRDELLKKLDELIDALRNNDGDLEEALADISRLEEEIQQKMDPQFLAQQAMLESMTAQLQNLAKQSSTLEDLAAAEEIMEQLAAQMEAMSEEEKEALAEALAQMSAQAAQAGLQGLSLSMAEMTQAMQNNDAQAAVQAAQAAVEAMKQAGQQQASQKANQNTLAQLQSARQSMANANPSKKPGQAAAQKPKPASNNANNQQSGQCKNPGAGSGQNPGSGGGGSTANQMPPRTGQGQIANWPKGQVGPQQAWEMNLEGQPAYQQQENAGDELYIPGQDSGSGEYQEREQKDPLAGMNNPVLVPYQTIYQQYSDTASQAIEKSYIPLALKDYVRNYFAELEP